MDSKIGIRSFPACHWALRSVVIDRWRQ